MSDNIFTTTIVKAVDDLSHKAFIPITIIAAHIDYLVPFSDRLDFTNFWVIYVFSFLVGGAFSLVTIVLLWICDEHINLEVTLSKKIEFSSIVGVFLLPLSAVAIFPQSFGLESPIIPLATGIACGIWGLLLVGDKKIVS